MDLTVFLAVLLAAVMHASWNVMVKLKLDRFLSLCLIQTLMGLMGRMAAYTGQEVTWEQALHSQEKLTPDTLDWNTKIALPPLAKPGRTKLI